MRVGNPRAVQRFAPREGVGDGGSRQTLAEIVFEFDNGDEDVFTPKQREEFESYELHQMAVYIDSIAHSIRKGQKN